MRKLGILIALILCVIIGGGFALWLGTHGISIDLLGVSISGSLLCFVALIIVAVVAAVLIGLGIKRYTHRIRSGDEDEIIVKELKIDRRKFRIGDLVNGIIMGLLVIALFSSSIFSLYVYLVEEHAAEDVPSIMVVTDSEMAEKAAGNIYLTEKGLNDQVKKFDLITIKKLPPEIRLELYDVVVYEKDGALKPLRIVEIKEEDGHKRFVLQGDAQSSAEAMTVEYSQLRGVYEGKRFAFVGSVILFLQSLAGYLCIFLVMIAIIVTPFLARRIYIEKKKRLALILAKPQKKEKKPVEPSVIDELEIFKFDIKSSRKRDIIMFRDKLRASTVKLQEQYVSIVKPLLTVKDIRESYSAQYQTFKQGKTPVARLKVKNNTLYAYLGLDPDSKQCHGINVTDVSSISTFVDFPVQIKVTDDNIDTVRELIFVVIEQKHLETT